MNRLILLQYRRGERSDAPVNVTGTFDYLKDAMEAAAKRLSDCNEIVDTETWEVVWRFTTQGVRL